MIHPSYVCKYSNSLVPVANESMLPLYKNRFRKISYYAQSCNHLMHFDCFSEFERDLAVKVLLVLTTSILMQVCSLLKTSKEVNSFAHFARN